MRQCERIDYCTFFADRLRSMPSSVDMFKHNYCMTNRDDCARYMIHRKLMQGFAPESDTSLMFIEREMKRLYPNDVDAANMIIGWLVKT